MNNRMQTNVLEEESFEQGTLLLSREGASSWLVQIPEQDILYYYSYENAARKTYIQLRTSMRAEEYL